jgi:hypothetical protein
VFITLWKRKFYFITGYAIGLIIGLLNISLGQKIEINQLIILPFGTCFIFGFLLYLIFEQREKFIKEGRMLILSKDGLIHLGLTFSVAVIYGILSGLTQ